MCGFAGVISFDDRYRVDDATLHALGASLAHRGPDGAGYFANHHDAASDQNPRVTLAFRRLAVLDPCARSDQPFTIDHHTLCFNGEVYNFRHLRRELGERFWRTTGDTEVLLRMLIAHGTAALPRLDGMFAFAWWDDRAKRLLLARDRMGVKPLFLTQAPDGGAVAFASELHTLRRLPWFDEAVSPSSLADYLLFGYVPGERTIFANAAKLRPGRTLSITGPSGTPQQQAWFDATAHVSPAAFGPDKVATTRSLVRQAVEKRLVSDVPLGCWLSGGIDSSIVAACMKQAGGEVQTFSIGFDDARYDESPHARRVAQHLGTRHHAFRVTADAAEDLPRLAHVFGEPFADSSALPTHYLARETRKHVTVALSGDGGDEMFGGYDRYRALRLADRVPAPMRAMASMNLWQHLPGTHPRSPSARLKRFARTLGLPTPLRYASIMRLFDGPTVMALLQRSHLNTQDSQVGDRLFESFAIGRDVVAAAAMLDRVTYLPDDLLVKADRASMLHGLEVRSPFLDTDIVRFAGTLTADDMLAGGSKRLLRLAFSRDLPAEVFARRKMGFAVPIGDWFRNDLRPMLHDLLRASGGFAAGHLDMTVVDRLLHEHATGRCDHAQRLYALLMLELWWRDGRG